MRPLAAAMARAGVGYVGRFPRDAETVQMGPILCAGVTTYKGLKETETKPGEWIPRSGASPPGLRSWQVVAGAAAICPRRQRFEWRRRLGERHAHTDP